MSCWMRLSFVLTESRRPPAEPCRDDIHFNKAVLEAVMCSAVMCGLRTRPRTDVDPQWLFDPWTDSGSLFPEKLRMRTDSHRRNYRWDREKLVPQLLGWGTNNVLVTQLLGCSFQKARNFTASIVTSMRLDQLFHIYYSTLRRHFSR